MSLENFEVIRRLGEGAFSSVFKVTRKSDGQCYALKKVKLGSLSVKEKENALNEIRILASLNHPNIIAYKDSFIDESSNTLCIVMELAESGDLFKKITEHKKNMSHFPEFEIMCALVQITNGLKYLHSANIIHRDLKCANIFISNDGTFKLGDLNVSKVQKGGMARTQTGTPYYASPEVWKDKPYTFSSDVWSLGCVVYEMAALDPPFTASDMQSLFKKITKGDYPPIPHFYSENLSTVLKRLLQINPVKRPTCEKILELSPVQKFKNLNPAAEQGLPDLLKTIKFEPSLQNLRNKLPSPQYENRGFSAKLKLNECSSNRDIGSRRELYRYESLHSRESPKVPLGRQVSLEAIERNRNRNMLRLDAELPDVIGRYQPKPPLISPEKYARKIEEIINRQFPDSRVKHLNKVGAMILDYQRPPVKPTPVNHPYFKEPGILNIAVNPMWL